MAKQKRKKATPSAAKPKAKPGSKVSEEERRRLVAERAYYLAEKRGFAGGDPRDDWLQAEAEINRELGLEQGEQPSSAAQQKKELAAYERLREDMEKILSSMRENVSVTNESLRRAFEEAEERLRKAGKYSAVTIEKAIRAVQKDFADAAHKMGPQWEEFSEKGADLFAVWRDRSRAFLSHAAAAVGEWVREAGARFERRDYRAGELAYPGTFACMRCGERITLAKAAHIPRCPRCKHGEFHRL